MLIGIIGKMGAGKDTFARIMQILQFKKDRDYLTEMELITISTLVQNWDEHKDLLVPQQKFENKKFAEGVKEFTAKLLGVTMEQMEDRKFKDAPIKGFEYWEVPELTESFTGVPDVQLIFSNKEEAAVYAHNLLNRHAVPIMRTRTPRDIQKLLGEDFGRNMVHPDIWAMARFSDYKPWEDEQGKTHMPWWLVTDVRYPNEAEIVRKNGGILVRINRKDHLRFPEVYKQFESQHLPFDDFLYEHDYSELFYHKSETALDGFEAEYDLFNNTTLIDFIKEVRKLWLFVSASKIM